MYYYVQQEIAPVAFFNIEKPFFLRAQEDIANNDFSHKSGGGAENFGGLFVPVSGTSVTASGTANQYVYSMVYIPETGPLPAVEMERHQDAKNMEQSAEIRLGEK